MNTIDPSKPSTGMSASFHRWMRPVVSSVVVVIAAAVFAVAMRPSGDDDGTTVAEDATDAPPLPVQVVRVGSIDGQEFAQRYAGILIPKRESVLSFERGGRVIRIAVREGTEVKRGDVLAELDQEDLDANEDRIESELAAAEALLDELVAGPRRQSIEAAEAKVKE